MTEHVYKIETIRQIMSSIGEVIELVGSSDKSWANAAQVAVNEATKTIRGIRGIEVKDMTAKVDRNTGKIQEYRVCVKLSFAVERWATHSKSHNSHKAAASDIPLHCPGMESIITDGGYHHRAWH